MLLHSWVLLPPKSLRSRLGDSERFNPLQREGERFTADDEGEGWRKGKEGWCRERRGDRKQRGRDRERDVVY